MTTPGQWTDLIGSTAIDSDGEKVGKVGQIYLDDATGQPAWVTVSTGLFGMRESLAPLYNARPGHGEVHLAVTKQMIKDAPNVGTEEVAAGRARLRKYVVTEPVSTTVPVSHEEVRIEREPVTDANAGAAMSGPDISEEEHEVTLRAERPVVDKEAVPVERVRLGTETVTEEHQVNEEVRKEQIDEPNVDADLRRDRR
jgi:uncharacterized protein (TIGR02271 family)